MSTWNVQCLRTLYYASGCQRVLDCQFHRRSADRLFLLPFRCGNPHLVSVAFHGFACISPAASSAFFAHTVFILFPRHRSASAFCFSFNLSFSPCCEKRVVLEEAYRFPQFQAPVPGLDRILQFKYYLFPCSVELRPVRCR